MLLGLVISSMGLVGCNNSAVASFKNYTFQDFLTGQKRDELLDRVARKLADLTAINKETYNKTKSDNNAYELKGKNKIVFYDQNHVHMDSSSDSITTKEGIAVKDKDKSTYDSFDWEEKNIVYRESNDGIYYLVSEKSETSTLSDRITTYFKNYVGDYTTLRAYKDGNGYAFATSTITETREDVLGGDLTREHYTKSRSQQIFKVNSNYEFTSWYSYRDKETNRDPGTNRWYDKAKRIETYSMSATFKYGEREYGQSIKNNVVSKFENGYIDKVTVKASRDYGDSETVATVINPTSLHIRATYHIGNYYNYQVDSVTEQFTATVIRHSALTSEAKTDDYSIKPEADPNSGITIEDSAVTFPIRKSSDVLVLEFNVNLSDRRISISDTTISII